MRKTISPAWAVALLVLAANGSASADISFSLENVTFVAETSPFGPAGTLSGSFTTNDALNLVISADITASPAPNSDGYTFPGFTYTLANSDTATTNLPDELQLNSNTGNGFQLRLLFDGGLTASGANLVSGSFATNSSFEFERGFGAPRLVSTGSVVAPSAVPEPSTYALLGVAGVAALGYSRFRR